MAKIVKNSAIAQELFIFAVSFKMKSLDSTKSICPKRVQANAVWQGPILCR